MWACVCTSACACAGVFAHARACTCMGIVRVHAYMCRVRMHACTLCGRMLACDCVHVRSAGARAHVCMCGCVCACACACTRVHARVRVRVRSRVFIRSGVQRRLDSISEAWKVALSFSRDLLTQISCDCWALILVRSPVCNQPFLKLILAPLSSRCKQEP